MAVVDLTNTTSNSIDDLNVRNLRNLIGTSGTGLAGNAGTFNEQYGKFEIMLRQFKLPRPQAQHLRIAPMTGVTGFGNTTGITGVSGTTGQGISNRWTLRMTVTNPFGNNTNTTANNDAPINTNIQSSLYLQTSGDIANGNNSNNGNNNDSNTNNNTSHYVRSEARTI